MIKVTRLDGNEYFVNPHQIESIEIRPDTTLVMLSGKKLIIREEVKDILKEIEAYHRRINPFIGQIAQE
jgi:flagellar protein FlbD